MIQPRISVIGAGALGSVLVKTVTAAGYSLESIYNRTEKKAREVVEPIGVQKIGVFPKKVNELGTLIFLAVADGHISEAAKKLAAIHQNFSGYTIVHCSGTQSSAVLQPLREKGAAVASFHPLQTFTAQSIPSDFEEIFIDIEGDEMAVVLLKELAKTIGAKPLSIQAEAKPYLHAAAVMASNNLIGLIESATQIAALGGMEKKDALNALMPLIKHTLENIASNEEMGQALSGPVARGDTATVNEHVQLLEQKPQLKALYQQLGSVLAEIANEQGQINARQYDVFKTLFKDVET